MAATSLKAEELQSAFELFNRQSGVLETSYWRLQSRVETLTTQLKVAQSERRAELVAKERLSQLLSELQQRQERLMAIGEMTASFAHQVRTPLASAMLYTAQLDRNSPKQQRVVQKITARLNELGRMVNDMLGFAAGARGAQETVDVPDLLTDVQRSLEAQLDEHTSLRVSADAADWQVAANRDALKGALMNLVTNAMQACANPGEIVLSASRTGDDIALAVTDNGPGIPADVVPRLFEPFFTTRPQGTGLGLPIVQAVANAHGGDVLVETSASGSCFTLRLPAKAQVDGGPV